jgi:hypothetical protein
MIFLAAEKAAVEQIKAMPSTPAVSPGVTSRYLPDYRPDILPAQMVQGPEGAVLVLRLPMTAGTFAIWLPNRRPRDCESQSGKPCVLDLRLPED